MVVIEDTLDFKVILLMLGVKISPHRCKCGPSNPIGILARFVGDFGPSHLCYCCVALDILNHHRPRVPTCCFALFPAAFLQTAHFRLFTLLSSDLSVKSGKWARMHESSAG